jgi:protein ImuB
MTATQAKSIAGSLQKFNTNTAGTNTAGTNACDWTWIEHDTQEDLEEIYSLAERLMQFSPLVGVESIDKTLWAGRSILQPQSIFIDITGLEPWYGGELAMAQELQGWLTKEGRFACIGIADSLGQAWAVSNYAFRKQVTAWMLQIERAESSLPESLKQNPRIERIASGATWEAFRHLPIESLRLDIETVAKLHRLGIRSIDSLRNLPRQSLTSRFGSRLLERIDQCLNAHPESISVRNTGEALEVCIDFEHPIFHTDELHEALQDATEQLCQKLDSTGHGAWRLLVRLGLEVSTMQLEQDAPRAVPSHLIQLGLFQTSNDPKHLLWLIDGCLERNPPHLGKNLGIKQILIQAPWTSPIRWKQNALFDSQSLRYRDEAAKLIDGLAARFGRNQVVGLSLVQDPIPERQTKSKPLTGLRNDGTEQSTQRKLRKAPIEDFQKNRSMVPGTESHWTRPLQLLPTPIRLNIQVDANGTPTSGGLASAANKTSTAASDLHAIVEAIGPERIESSWWSGPTIRRNYYRVALDSGLWWWIYQDLVTLQWYLHGMFH